MENYTTRDVSTRDIVPFWQDVVCKSYVPIDCHFDRDAAFKASMSLRRHGHTDLSRVDSMAVQYERRACHIRANGDDDYLVTLITKGQTIVEQQDRSCRIGPGDLCLLDTARPYRFDYPLPYQAIHLKIPRGEVDRRLPIAENMVAARVAAGGRYARLAATMLQSTLDILGDDTSDQPRLEPALIDLIALAFDETHPDASQGNDRYAQIVTRAQAVISERLFEADFDVSTIPTEIGVSPRSLYRAFAQHGTTPARHVSMQRLDAARDLIASGRAVSVSAVAMACGFNEFSHFSRAFKARFSIPPRQMMEIARRDPDAARRQRPN